MRPSPPVISPLRRARPPFFSREILATPMLRSGATALAVSGLLLLLTWTLFRDATRLIPADFFADTWFIEHQADSLRQSGSPSHFLNGNLALFYPVFAFYGGTLFVCAAAIALLVGSAATAQVIVYVLALAAAYGGWLWLARLAGLGSWRAHVPAIVYVTAPYVLTNMYVRQDLAESVATASIPPLLASALSVLRADRLRAGPAAALAASTVIFGGSHNLTLLWGTTILGITGLAFVAGLPQTRRWLTATGVLRVLAVVVPALSVNAWYLVPELAYHSQTVIAHRIDEWRAVLRTPSPVLETKYLFALGRPSGLPGSGLTCTLPVLTMAWVIAAAVAARGRWRTAWARTLAILSWTTIVILVLMTHVGLLSPLPDPWLMLQFSYRLETFALFGICGAVIAGLALLGGTHRLLVALLLPIVALSVVGAMRQVREVPLIATERGPDMSRSSTFSVGDFADASLRRLPLPTRAKLAIFDRADVRQRRLETTVSALPGDVIYTDLMTLPQMVDVEGARVVGRWPAPPRSGGWQLRWYLALRIDDDAVPGNAHIVVTEARSLPIVGGRIISILGLLGLAANAAVIAQAAVRRRREAAT